MGLITICDSDDLQVVTLSPSITDSQKSTHSSLLNDLSLTPFADAFQGNGAIPGRYKIHLKDNAASRVNSPQRIPIASQDAVTTALQSMVELGITTSTD